MVQRVVSLRINKFPELVKTIELYNKLVNIHISMALSLGTCSKARLHKALYRSIRRMHPCFPSALVQCARDNAAEMLRGNKYNRYTRKRLDGSIRFDLRACKVFLESGQVQFTTIKGRKKYNVRVPDYFHKYFGWRIKAATLGVSKDFLVLKVVVEGEKTKKYPNCDVLGIDLGIKNFAVLSNSTFIKPKKIRSVKRKYAYLRRRLQSRGTRSARKKLRALGGRERRFMTDFNHCISKGIAGLPYGAFALENLRGIRDGRKGRVFNRMRSNWAYHQFRQFLAYKSEDRGKKIVLVNPRHTSQRCSSCGFTCKPNRSKGNFRCRDCGFHSSADLNASKNISQIGQSLLGQVDVNQPNVTAEQDSDSSMLVTNHAP